MVHLLRSCLAAPAVMFVVACSGPPNPSFPLTTADANAALREMRESPQPQQRPLVIVGGYGDPGFATSSIRDRIAPLLRDPCILTVELGSVDTFAAAREVVVKAVDEAFPSDDPRWTTEVDVIGNSMGGLVVQYATDPTTGERSLRAATLFAIGTPFRGAKVAEIAGFNEIVRDMQPGSSFLERLNAADPVDQHQLVPYTRTDDVYVGAANTAPPGQSPWWVPGEPFNSGHMTSFSDPRFIADIARRVRGETPYASEPRTPLPER